MHSRLVRALVATHVALSTLLLARLGLEVWAHRTLEAIENEARATARAAWPRRIAPGAPRTGAGTSRTLGSCSVGYRRLVEATALTDVRSFSLAAHASPELPLVKRVQDDLARNQRVVDELATVAAGCAYFDLEASSDGAAADLPPALKSLRTLQLLLVAGHAQVQRGEYRAAIANYQLARRLGRDWYRGDGVHALVGLSVRQEASRALAALAGRAELAPFRDLLARDEPDRPCDLAAELTRARRVGTALMVKRSLAGSADPEPFFALSFPERVVAKILGRTVVNALLLAQHDSLQQQAERALARADHAALEKLVAPRALDVIWGQSRADLRVWLGAMINKMGCT